MRIIPVTRARRGRRGASATELALLLPILLLLLVACVDFGRIAYGHIAVTNAARAAAGFGSVNPFTASTQGTWTTQVRQAAIDEMSQMSGFNQSQLTVTATSSTSGEPNGMWRVQVSVSYPFQTLITWPGIPHNNTLQRTVVLRGTR